MEWKSENGSGPRDEDDDETALLNEDDICFWRQSEMKTLKIAAKKQYVNSRNFFRRRYAGKDSILLNVEPLCADYNHGVL